MLESVTDKLLTVPPWIALSLVFLLPALEASAFLGFIFPGEIAVILGGVVASRGNLSLGSVIVAAILGAVIGDSIGYAVGRKWGVRLLRRVPDRLIDDHRLEKAQVFVRRLGAKAIVLGRWTAALRVLVPGLAGMSHLPYGRFAVANVLGGAGWATTFVLAGFYAGESWHKVSDTFGKVSQALLALVVLAGVVAWVVHKRRERAR